MAYSDRDMLVATQIAYYDFDVDILENNNYNASIRELLEQDPGVYNKLQATLNDTSLGADERYRAEQAMDLYQDIMRDGSPYGDWVMKAVKDDNVNSGFYGCLIENSSGDAIIGFRGSESDSATQVVNDWMKADLGLLIGDETRQQQIAEDFMKEIYAKYDYDNYYTTGHSLGGNLSNHAAVTAPEGMRDKIIQSYSFDGPGFSRDYLETHRDEIGDSQGKLTHYQWSLVGGLLFQPDGIHNEIIKIKDDSGVGLISAQRHDTGFVEFDEHGNVIQGNQDFLSRLTDPVSKFVDWGIDSVSYIFVTVVEAVEKYTYLDEIKDWICDNTYIDEFIDGVAGWIQDALGLRDKDANQMIGGTGRNTDFKINLAIVRASLSDLHQYAAVIGSMADELGQIRGALNSRGMSKVRRRLKEERANLETLRRKLDQYQNKGSQIGSCYERAEQRIVGMAAGR